MICQVWLLCIQSYIQVQLKASIQPNFVEVQNKFFSPEKKTKKKKGVEGEFIRISCFLSYFLSVILSLISSWKQRNGKIETLLKGERLKKDNDRKNAKIAQKLPNGVLATSAIHPSDVPIEGK